MQPQYELQYHDVEANHWWFRSRRAYILQLLKHVPRDYSILDIGCSSGIMLLDLADAGFNKENLFGIDISSQAIANAHKNGLPQTYVMDAQEVSFDRKFDIIIASDCLEHLEFDEKALLKWKDLLTERGLIYVFVPAFQSLWSNHDVVNMHHRRYTTALLVKKAREAGFKILKAGHWNVFLFPPVWVYRRLMGLKKDGRGDIAQPGVSANRLLLNIMKAEHQFLRIFKFPFGVSTYFIAKR